MNKSNRTIALARQLRRNQTDTEARLWAHLRDRRLKGMKFRRQHPIGRYILDFYCPEAHLAIELDGSGHKRPEQKEHDKKRDLEIRDRGIKILRFWDNSVWENLEGVLMMIWNELPELPLTPNPSPPRGEGDALELGKHE